jgi:hypothetical protein
MSDNKDNNSVKRNTCLQALDKLLLHLKEGQWIFVPKNKEDVTALNILCTADDISFDDLTAICHYLKLMQTKKCGGKEQLQVPVEKWEHLKGQLFDVFGDNNNLAVWKVKSVHDKGRSDFVFLCRGSIERESSPIPVWADSSVARRELHSKKRPFTPGYARAKQGPNTQKKIKLNRQEPALDMKDECLLLDRREKRGYKTEMIYHCSPQWMNYHAIKERLSFTCQCCPSPWSPVQPSNHAPHVYSPLMRSSNMVTNTVLETPAMCWFRSVTPLC